MKYYRVVLITFLTFITICHDSYALNEIKITDRTDVKEICNKYGLDINNYILFKDNRYFRPNGEEIKITETNYTKAIEGKYVNHPKNKKVRIKVENVEVETFKDEVIMYAKFNINTDNKNRYKVGLNYGDIIFPVKIDKCYFTQTSIEEGITKYELTVNKKLYYVIVDKNGAITGNIIKLKDGTTLKVVEITENIKPFLPDYQGPAMNVEYTDKYGIKSKSVLLYINPTYERNKRPFDAVITDRKTQRYHKILGYCD